MFFGLPLAREISQDLAKSLNETVVLIKSKKMKSRIIFLLALGAIISCGYVIHASNPDKVLVQSESLDTPPGEKIILLGNLLFGINPNAIEASVTDDAVYVQFNQSFGSVSISLYNGMGTLVYGNVVNTDVQQVVVIPIANMAIGSYTLKLDNATGDAEGDFERN